MQELATMGADTAADLAAVVDRLRSALAAGQLEVADEFAAALPDAVPAAARMLVAQLHMRRQRWAAAAQSLARVAQVDSAALLQRNVCRNLASLERHRPEICQALLSCTDEDRYAIDAGAGGQPTIYYRRPDGGRLCLSAGGDPAAGLLHAQNLLRAQIEAGDALCLNGIGDGWFLRHLAQNPPLLPFERQQAICLIEPDARAVLACLMLHDLSGPTGPIEQARFAWFTGTAWRQCMERHFLSDPANAMPVHELRQCVRAAEVSAGIQEILVETRKRHAARQRELEAYYAGITHAHWAAIFSLDPPRTPRVLLVTTRFSTVLQYSTRDAADGFRANGWDSQLFIEPSPHHGLTLASLSQSLLEFKPDLVFQLDHLRPEWEGAFPPSLPFACWIQDHLPNLTTAAAGAGVTRRDFILCGMPAMYIDRHGYPPRQCIHMARLTRIPERPATWEAHGDDLVYVSTASVIPAERAREVYEDPVFDGPTRVLLKACCVEILTAYGRGDSLPTPLVIANLVQRTAERVGLRINSDERRSQMADLLFDRLSNPLYRQQALRWAAEIAKRHNLRLAIYGPGWERHPDFAPFARGPITYGANLESLTRASRINLVLEPYFGPSHQRLLDALVAGGFCLVRHHPSNTIFQELLNFLCGGADRENGGDRKNGDVPRFDSPRFGASFSRLACEARPSAPGTAGRASQARRLNEAQARSAAAVRADLKNGDVPRFDSPRLGASFSRLAGEARPLAPGAAGRASQARRLNEAQAHSTAAVRAGLSPADALVFDDILHRWNDLFSLGDPVAYVTGALEAGKMAPQAAALPGLDQVSFSTCDELEARVLAFIGDASWRRDIARKQRQDVESRVSYAAGMERVINCIGTLIAAEAAP